MKTKRKERFRSRALPIDSQVLVGMSKREREVIEGAARKTGRSLSDIMRSGGVPYAQELMQGAE